MLQYCFGSDLVLTGPSFESGNWDFLFTTWFILLNFCYGNYLHVEYVGIDRIRVILNVRFSFSFSVLTFNCGQGDLYDIVVVFSFLGSYSALKHNILIILFTVVFFVS